MWEIAVAALIGCVLLSGSALANGPLPNPALPMFTMAGTPACISENSLQTVLSLLDAKENAAAEQVPGCGGLKGGLKVTYISSDGVLDPYYKVALTASDAPPIVVWVSAFFLTNSTPETPSASTAAPADRPGQ